MNCRHLNKYIAEIQTNTLHKLRQIMDICKSGRCKIEISVAISLCPLLLNSSFIVHF